MQANDSTPRAAQPALLTVNQFCSRWQAWSQASLRALILNSQDRLNSRGERIAGNGLAEFGAVLRCGRKVLIDEAGFMRWLQAQQKKAA